MKLKCVNIATPNPSAMSRFYSLVLGQPCRRRAPNRFEIPAGGAFVVITHSDTKTPVNPDCCGLEFAVDDVDAEYERLLSVSALYPVHIRSSRLPGHPREGGYLSAGCASCGES